MSNLAAIIVFGTLLHVIVLAVMIWIRVRRTEPDPATAGPVRITPCAVCGSPATTWTYDGQDPNEQVNTETGRAWSYDTSHYQPVCEAHWHVAAHRA